MEILSSLILSRLRGLSQAQALSLLRYYGTAEAALSDEAPECERWGELLRDKPGLKQAREQALREREFCEEHRVQIIPFSSDAYPMLLKADEIPDAPINLFYKGTGRLGRRHVLSVVGTRHITDYGKQLCESLFADLGRLLPDLLIVSGLAYGVDIHAHRASLANGLDTVAVLAHGHDRIYPRMHQATADEMTCHGGLLTEYFTGTVPDKGNFVRRNRIVAGISSGTLVIESAGKGGALITATIAGSYNREVMAVPGRLTDAYSEGCNRLIRDNRASLVLSAEDVLRTLGWEAAPARAAKEPTLFPMFTPEQERVIDALEKVDNLSIDQLSLQTGISVSALTELLFDLEDSDIIVRMPGNRVRMHG